MIVKTMKFGLPEFSTKPFDGKKLLDTVEQILAGDSTRRKQKSEISSLRARFDRLTPDEREVMGLAVSPS